MKIHSLIVLGLATLLLGACAEKTPKLDTDKQKYSYAIGYQLAQNLKRQNIDLDPGAVSLAMKDVLSGQEVALSNEQMQAAIQSLQAARQKQMQATAEKNKAAGEAFLAENKKKEGVVTTKSGLQYKVVKKGTGRKPKSSDTVEVHYRGTLIDGKEFDSSYRRNQPAVFPVHGVIKGWQEVLPMMKEGAKWHVAIPSQLAYGERGAGPSIGPNQVLVFEIELLKIKNPPKKSKK